MSPVRRIAAGRRILPFVVPFVLLLMKETEMKRHHWKKNEETRFHRRLIYGQIKMSLVVEWSDGENVEGKEKVKAAHRALRNKAGYTANTSCGRVGRGVFTLSNSITMDGRTNGRTDRGTDGQSDGRMDKASCRVACPQLKKQFYFFWFIRAVGVIVTARACNELQKNITIFGEIRWWSL